MLGGSCEPDINDSFNCQAAHPAVQYKYQNTKQEIHEQYKIQIWIHTLIITQQHRTKTSEIDDIVDNCDPAYPAVQYKY